MGTTTDQLLLAAANAGDQDAQQGLLLRRHRVYMDHARQQLDPQLRRRVDAEDVVQDVYARAFAEWPAFANLPGMDAWFKQVIRNRVTDLRRAAGCRKRDVHRELSQPAGATSYVNLLDRLASPQSTPSRVAARKETVALLLTSLARLSDDQRRAVRLRFIEERSVAEVAAALGKTADNVYVLTYRGLERLKKLLDGAAVTSR